MLEPAAPKRKPRCGRRERGSSSVGDVMLAQKFALELFESDALNAANR